MKVDCLVLFFSLANVFGGSFFPNDRPAQGGPSFTETSHDRTRKPTRNILDIDDFDDAVFFAVVLSTNQDGTAVPISRLGLRS